MTAQVAARTEYDWRLAEDELADRELVPGEIVARARIVAVETAWGVEVDRDVTPFGTEEAARQHQDSHGGELVSRVTYDVVWS
jgi:hypothetical protein